MEIIKQFRPGKLKGGRVAGVKYGFRSAESAKRQKAGWKAVMDHDQKIRLALAESLEREESELGGLTNIPSDYNIYSTEDLLRTLEDLRA